MKTKTVVFIKAKDVSNRAMFDEFAKMIRTQLKEKELPIIIYDANHIDSIEMVQLPVPDVEEDKRPEIHYMNMKRKI